MNLVDSCGWLEYFSDGGNAKFFEKAILKTEDLLVPSICIYEVFKRIYLEKDEAHALEVTVQMRQGKKVDFDADIAFQAAKISIERQTPMADSIIMATADKYKATIWTQDKHFATLPQVRYIEKK